ncbi:hypothetical protein [Sulfurimonas sp.]|uniref:hypothetical protein n=1 Tax=Sulfurimonas sp. TaxID=2022749 RepID=UPI003D0ED1F6
MAVFEIDNEDIKRLGEVELPKLVYQIMYYEIAKLNLLNQGLHISLNTKTGDGGSDGEFNIFNKQIPANHQFLPNNSIVFQFKAAEIGAKAWFEKEIIDEKTKDLKPKLKEYIQQNYTYILITNRTDLPASNLEAKEKILKDLFNDYGYSNVSVKIIDLTKLAEWANSIPQIYLTQNPNTRYFELFESYENEIRQNSEDVEYVNDEKRESDILQIRDNINNTLRTGTSSFIRIEGFSGIGKTRFVYEALNNDDFKQLVIYVQMYNDELFGDLLLYCKKRAENTQELVIFVIDECSYEDHIRICRGLKQYSNLVIITINQLLSEQDKVNCKEEYRITLEGLSEEKSVELIQKVNPILDNDIAKKIAYYTEGYPRLAYFMASSYDVESGDTHSADEKSQLLDKTLSTITNDADEIVILQAISIFKLFPDNDDVKIYKKIIFEHFDINIAKASVIIQKLIKKGIIRNAGRFLYISPRPISIHLFNQFLSTYDYEFIDELFIKLDNQGLMNSFFEKLQGIEFDSRQHKELLFRILSKLTYEQINDELGSKIFYSLCLKDREYSIGMLTKLFHDKSTDELLQFNEGRRYIVFALDKLISFENTFNDSAKILFRLAMAENESWGNNSKGIFKDSFTWILSGTEVNIVDRLNFLKELYKEYSDKESRMFLLDSLSNAYPKHSYIGSHKNSENFPENIPEHYRPNTQDEIDEYFVKLKELIAFLYEHSSVYLKGKILSDLISTLRTLIIYKQIDTWILDFIVHNLEDNTHLKGKFLEEISFTLKHDKGDKSDEVLKYLHTLNNKALSTENIDEVKEMFYSTEQYRYHDEDVFNQHCRLLAENLFKTKDFDILLNSHTSNTFFIGKELALIDSENTLYDDILALMSKLDKNSNMRFITGYIFNNKMSDESQFKKLFDEIYNRLNDKSLMFEFIYASNGNNEIIFEYLFSLLEKKEIASEMLERLIYGFWLREVKVDDFEKFIDKINSIIENKCDSFPLCRQYIQQNKNKHLIEKYLPYYISNDILKCKNVRIDRDIVSMTESYLSYGLEFSTTLLEKVWESVLIEFKNNGNFERSEFDSVYKILEKYPDFFWNKLKDNLDEVQPSKYPTYSTYLHFTQGGYLARHYSNSIFRNIDTKKIVEWLKTTPFKDAKYLIADSLNIDFQSNTLPEIVIKLLEEYPNDIDLYYSITVKSEGWTGSYVHVANEKISNVDKMLEDNKDNKKVMDFLLWAKKSFESRKERAQREDEERNIY